MSRNWIACLLLAIPLAIAAADAPELARLQQAQSALETAESALKQAPEGQSAREAATALAAARSARERAQTAIDKRTEVVAEGQRATRELPRLQAELARDAERALQVWRDRIAAGSRVSALEALLANENSLLEAARARVQRAEAASALIDGGATDAERYAGLKLRQDDLTRQLASPALAALDELLKLARSAQLSAELAAVDAELALLEEARRTAESRNALTLTELGVAQAEVALAERKVEWLQQRISAASAAELQALRERVAQQLEEIDPENAALKEAAGINLSLADELVATTQRLAERRRDTQAFVQERDRIAAALTSTDARLALVGGNETVGQLLLAERRRLGKPALLQAQLNEVRSELASTRLRLLDLPALETAILAAEAPPLDAQDADPRALARISETRGQLLQTLQDRLQKLQATLEQADLALRRQTQDAQALAATLDRELLWIPSHSPLGKLWWSRMWQGWADFLSPPRWMQAVGLLLQRVVERPWPSLLGLLLVGALFHQRRAISERIVALTPPYRRISEDRFRLSTQTLGWSLLYASPWPLLLVLLGSQWQHAGELGKFSHSLGLILTQLAGSLFLLSFLRVLVRERGLAHAHFRWTRPRRESIQSSLPHAVLVLLPLQFVAGLSLLRGVEPAVDVCARLALIAFVLYGGWMGWRLLAPGALWTPRGQSEPQRWRMLFRAAVPVLFAALLMMLVSGYVYTASVLMKVLWQTVWTVLAIAIVHGLLARWFLLGERRLAHERLLAQREQERQGEARAGSGDEMPETAAEIVSLESVNAQTSRLLRATTLTLWVAGLLWVWSDIVPALARLDEIALWTTRDLDSEGQAVQVAVSLKSLLFGIAALALTWIAARNLPGLLEIGLLSRISLDAPSRYAIASISRYLIVIVGSMVGLGLLGLRWSQLQWMAAALSVGLGFGLQEIFGNFVSGLILLFERPFRVGDVITIGEFSGTVTRIRTRATTLVDFDNKEVVIPNKAFITERLINWTLSDTRTRVIIRVGVAYGSDVELVHRLLKQAAAEHPLVLDEPAPTSWLLAFGPSSLDFELRVFVGAIADRMPVTNDLHARIAALFSEHTVVIAYPQVDLHLRETVLATALPNAAIKPAAS